MIAVAERFPDSRIVQTASAQLSWSHLLEIARVADPLARSFYVEMARLERWNVRTLEGKIRSLL